MPPQKRSSGLYRLVQIPVLAVIAGALFASGAALYENTRFVQATSQILSFVRSVRMFVEQQRTIIFTPDSDLWESMIRVGQFPQNIDKSNPWKNDLHATVDTNMAIRLESDLPPAACRRIALYFIGIGPADIGLLSIDARTGNDSQWQHVYPVPDMGAISAADQACGMGRRATLALTFNMH